MENNGFKVLDESLRKEHLYSDISYYSPWLFIFITFSLLGILSLLLPDGIIHGLTRTTINYVLLASLLITSPFNFSFVRFLGERGQSLSKTTLSGVYISSFISVFFIGIIAAIVFLFFSNSTLIFNLLVIILFLLISCSWQLLLFLSLSPHFFIVAAFYFIGFICVFILAVLGSLVGGTIGFLSIMNLGTVILFSSLWYFVSEKIKISYTIKFDFYSFISKKPFYLILGWIVILGFLIDKIIFWSSEYSKILNNVFRSYPAYETSLAMAFLTALPPIIYFILASEKIIYAKSRKLYESISLGALLKTIESDKKELVEELLKMFLNVLKIQVTTVFSINYLATQIFSLLKLPLENVILFRTALWGVASFVLISFIITILLYWDFKKHAMILSVLFLVTNAITSYIFLQFDQKHATYGFSIACFITLLAALIFIVYIIKNLVYILFKNPPIAYKVKIVKGEQIGDYLIKNGKRV